ncbi:ergothioneine biosynthesis glutamate--cysteine ligase EgtA [Streptomyces sp. NBC_01795]|uniref:ergothioneine biosynthesis glutamate--cysteine ligase EgtA n=1 Tax=unclassified Streptomyces TaxID=2593676 RepID=UPI002DDC650A|nr:MULTISPECIES: ergothioneine biosynthesis glutamate--cysteine ligase EgtA [unclassified Streptomyces]WSA90296.1 ergothioneine biosynthesis glutamate--cysteine ligase EgtA [Streptomyces sp. NBC_01795]WSB74521.1 ergothioneine biosynthesis glutamate--cysteine ligase EgtA [Streptomyces sp. NBC_01775]WSS17094.1 ergothioneine biosynthesis glutamate--cysteine ligase EgtA [Streptomyces sp. NBC_01186]
MTVIESGEARGLLSEEAALARVRGVCFKTGPPRRVGVELEWLVHPLDGAGAAPGEGSGKGDAAAPAAISATALRAAVDAVRELPLSSAISLEPGGQVEFSSPPATSLPACVETVGADLAAARTLLSRHGMRLVGRGLDDRAACRLLDDPRYRAMESFFDRTGPAGRIMMCSSASVQVCLDAGVAGRGPFGLGRRWFLAHVLGAVFTAAFANSPLTEGPWAGWRSGRQAVWAALDGYRNLAPAGMGRGDPRTLWARYALDAPVLCVRSEDGPWTVPGDGMTFREWINRSHTPGGPRGRPAGGPGEPGRPPDPTDLDYHLTTLFPPVRPQGHLELRMIDAQPGEDGWIVPLAVAMALFNDVVAAETAFRAVRPLAGLADGAPAPRNALWVRAARDGLTDPGLRAAAVTCFAAAREALPRLGAGRAVRAAVEEFSARYVARGRCPADDVLDGCRAAPFSAAPFDATPFGAAPFDSAPPPSADSMPPRAADKEGSP